MPETTTTLRDFHSPRPQEDLPVGTVVGGRYTVRAKIGEGGMGTVYLADDADLRRPVAVKLISGDADEVSRRRFEREARIMAGIRSSAIVQVHDLGVDRATGASFYVMDAHLLQPAAIDAICRGRLGVPPPLVPPSAVASGGLAPLTLEHVLSGDRSLAEDVVARLALEVLGALGVIHGSSPEIVHRDLKPSNLMFAADGRLLLSDFGIAKYHYDETEAQTSTLTMDGAGPGTPLYASPEQKQGGDITAASDFYSFGLVIYRMLTGGLPGTASSSLPSDVADRVSRRWNALLLKLLVRDPAARLCDSAVIARELKAILRACLLRRRSRSALQWAARRVAPAGLALAVLGLASFFIARGIAEYRRRCEMEAAEQRWLAEREAKLAAGRAKYAAGMDRCIDYYLGLASNVVSATAGQPVRVGEGETLNFFDIGENRPSEIILDGGRLLFARPTADLLALVERAREEKESVLASATDFDDKRTTYDAVGALLPWPSRDNVVFDIPLKIRGRNSKIQRGIPDVETVLMHGDISEDGGDGVMLYFSSDAMSGFVIDADRLSPKIEIDKRSLGKLVDLRRHKVVRWIEPSH